MDEDATTWLRLFLRHSSIYCDSKSAIAITCNPVQQTKHIDIRYHFIKDNVERRNIELYFVHTNFQLVDLFTKVLDEKRFTFLISKLNMINFRNYIYLQQNVISLFYFLIFSCFFYIFDINLCFRMCIVLWGGVSWFEWELGGNKRKYFTYPFIT